MPGIQSLEQWHWHAVGAQVASLTAQLTANLDKLTGKDKSQAASATIKTSIPQESKTWKRNNIQAERKTNLSSTSATEDGPIVCIEFTRGKRRVYRQASNSASEDVLPFNASFSVADDYVTHNRRLRDLFASYLLPQGYPDSVAPQYAKYMAWRGVQYFFGGAMSVFTTRSLLGAVGVANKHSGEAAAAINWVVKDGAGRVGRFLFARWGRELDCELKQFRLGGDILMESGAALELVTALAPRLFLPLACTANLAKNLAAVAASSTRAPIYRTFARQNNLADITAKGESVANLADVLGTLCGIMLARGNFPIVPTFGILSVGYLIASRREVDSVELPYLNRARLSYAARRYLATGTMPGLAEANEKEPLLPWSDPTANRIVLGATVEEACRSPAELKAALDLFRGRQYALTYRPETKKVYVMLRQGAGTEASLQGAMAAHCVLHLVNAAEGKAGDASPTSVGRNGGAVGKLRRQAQSLCASNGGKKGLSSSEAGDSAVAYVSVNGSELCSQFEDLARSGGWRLPLTMLNPSETRVHPV